MSQSEFDQGDAADAMGELYDDVMQAIGESELDTPAALCICMQVIFDHAVTEDGLAVLHSLFAQYEAAWHVERAKSSGSFYSLSEGVLQ